MLNRAPAFVFRILLIAATGLFLISCGKGDGPVPIADPTPPPADAYKLVWADEFDVDGPPDVRNWTMETGYGEGNSGWGNNEWQNYTDLTEDVVDPGTGNTIEKQNIRVEGGNLVITARCRDADPDLVPVTDATKCANGATADKTGTITSARINTKDKFEIKYGIIQARISTPGPNSKGTWPAFWMLGSVFPDTFWPKAGEIDIMEMHQFFSNDRTTHFTVHWCDETRQTDTSNCQDFSLPDNNGWRFESRFRTFDEPLTNTFRVYELEWTEKSIIGKIDGVTYYTIDIDPETREEFLNSFFIILNVAVGGSLGGPPSASTAWPQEMKVDWVRVYERIQPDVLEMVSDDPSVVRPYTRFINSAEFGGDSVVATVQRATNEDPDEDPLYPPAVPPLTGDTIVEFEYENANAFFSGAAFALNRIDLTHFEKLRFSLDTSQFPGFKDISIEMNDYRFTGSGPGNVALPLSNYPPVSESGNWKTFEIPLTDFDGVLLDGITLFGFWNPLDDSDTRIAGKLYLDDIKFLDVPCSTNGSASFDADNYAASATSAQISVTETCLANKNRNVVVVVDNGTEKIGVSVPINAGGQGAATINFGPTEDATGTIEINEGDVLTLTYTDTTGTLQSDTATIATQPLGVYSETHVDNVLAYTAIINDDTVTNEVSTAVTPLEGSVSLQADYSAVDAENGFAFDFSVAGGVSLQNGSFEADDASGGTLDCTAGQVSNWVCFNPSFVLSNNNVGEPGPLARDGSQVLKTAGGDGLARQSIAVTPGETINASAYVMNWSTDPFDNNLGILQLTFFDAGDTAIGGSEVYVTTDGSQGTTLLPKAGTSTNDWTLMEVSDVAPAGAVRAQILVIHVITAGSASSSLYWDDLRLEPAGTGPANDISAYKTLKFGINASASASLMDLEIRLTDGSAASESTFLADYTPTAAAVAGWDLYEIPLTAFAGVDLTNISMLGFYNASTDMNGDPSYPTLFNTTLYFDDVHFVIENPAALTGVLVNSPIEGVSFSTDTQSGITSSLGEFQYLPGEMITFSVGDIVLGTVPGAPVITPVDLTGSTNPTDQEATNQLVFLQSIDADQDPSNGITVSAATLAAAIGQTLDFSLGSAAFATAVTAVVNTIAPGNALVTETDAVNSYYQTFPPTGSAADTTISVSTPAVDADGSDASTITVQARDSSGNIITASAGTVTLSSTGNAVISSPVLDNGDGTYTATITNTTAETVTITGTIGGNTITGSSNVTVTFIGPVSVLNTTITATSPVEADGVSKSTITVQAKDVNGVNFVKSAGSVVLTITEDNPDNSASFDNGAQSTTATDNGNGTYTAFVKNPEAEGVTISGTIDGTPIDAANNAIIQFVVGAVDPANTTISVNPASVVNDGVATSTITVQAKDSGGNNIPNSAGTVTLASSGSGVIENLTDNNDGTYTATVKNSVAETVIITGTIGGNPITDDATVTFGPSVALFSDTNTNSVLSVTEIIETVSGCNLTSTTDLTSAIYPPLEGSNLKQVDYVSTPNACNGYVYNLGVSTSASLMTYAADFEDPPYVLNNVGILGDSWLYFVNVFDPTGTNRLYGYGPGDAPQGTGAMSDIVSGQGGTDQGAQQLSIYSDYNNQSPAGHAVGNQIEVNIFQEQTIGTNDIGQIWTFTFDVKQGNIVSPSTALAFIKTLDPNAGFNQTNFITFDTTSYGTNWGTESISIDLSNPLLDGQILQFGFLSLASNNVSSGVFYDNVSFTVLPTDMTGYTTLKFALDSSLAVSPALADLEVKLEDTAGGSASVYLSNYTPTPGNVGGADWNVYEIPLSDFTGTLDKTIVQYLGFLNASSTVSAPPGGTTTLFDATLYIDDIHFIEQP